MEEFELQFENIYSQQMSKAEFESKEDQLSTISSSISPLFHSNYLRKVTVESIGVVTSQRLFSEFSLIIWLLLAENLSQGTW